MTPGGNNFTDFAKN